MVNTHPEGNENCLDFFVYPSSLFISSFFYSFLHLLFSFLPLFTISRVRFLFLLSFTISRVRFSFLLPFTISRVLFSFLPPFTISQVLFLFLSPFTLSLTGTTPIHAVTISSSLLICLCWRLCTPWQGMSCMRLQLPREG